MCGPSLFTQYNNVTTVPRGSSCVYVVHVVKTNIRNYFAKTRRTCFEFHVYSMSCEIVLCAFYLNKLNRNIKTNLNTFYRKMFVYIRFEENVHVSLDNCNVVIYFAFQINDECK